MKLQFKKWLEFWGASFLQEPELTNGPAYAAKGVRSKYKGPGWKVQSDVDVDAMYGFDDKNKFLMKNKMKKKMNKGK